MNVKQLLIAVTMIIAGMLTVLDLLRAGQWGCRAVMLVIVVRLRSIIADADRVHLLMF
jgi:hypothetical protein